MPSRAARTAQVVPPVTCARLVACAPIPDALLGEFASSHPTELLARPQLPTAVLRAVFDQLLSGAVSPPPWSHPVPPAQLDTLVDHLATTDAPAPAALEWLTHQPGMAPAHHHAPPRWAQVLDALERSVHPARADTAARLSLRAPTEHRRRAAALALLTDRAQVLCLELAERSRPRTPAWDGPYAARDTEFLTRGALHPPIRRTGSLLSLAVLCRARPHVALALGDALSSRPAHEMSSTLMLAWTVPWHLARSHRRRLVTELANRLRSHAVADLSPGHAHPEALRILATRPAVPAQVRTQAACMLDLRLDDGYLSPSTVAHDIVFGPHGAARSRAALGPRRILPGPLATHLNAQLQPPVPIQHRPVPNADLPQLAAACAGSVPHWRLALQLADGTLTEGELAACVRAALG